MNIRVRCPGCDGGYVIDESAADNLICPACGSAIPVSSGVRAESDPAAADISVVPNPLDASPTPTPAAEVGATAADPVARSATAVAEPPADEEVVCPRCKLHFTPRRELAAGSHTVLIVEDLDYFREIAKDALIDDYQVKTASTLAEARQALAEGPVDLMVLDLTLDGGTHGIDLLRELPGKRFPILIYTAQDESEMYGERWDELRALGADDIVIKGMNVGESLQRTVGALLGAPLDEQEPLG